MSLRRPKHPEPYDSCIIGGGETGIAAALSYPSRKRLVMVDDSNFSGSWSLATMIVESLTRAAKGHATDPLDQVRGDLEGLGQKKRGQLQSAGIVTLAGQAKFLDRSTIQVGDQTISAKQFVIATGASPTPLSVDLPAKAKYYSLTDLLRLTELPQRLAIIGTSDLANQAALAIAQLGHKVSLLTEGELPDAITTGRLRQSRVTIEQIKLGSLEQLQRATQINYLVESHPKSLVVDAIIDCSGWRPNLALDLQKAEIEFDQDGIMVDRSGVTNIKTIRAIGACAKPVS